MQMCHIALFSKPVGKWKVLIWGNRRLRRTKKILSYQIFCGTRADVNWVRAQVSDDFRQQRKTNMYTFKKMTIRGNRPQDESYKHVASYHMDNQ